MAAITKVVNGITCTIEPAVFKTNGPSNQAIEFTSNPTTGASLPITITFSSPVLVFSIVAVGLSNRSHVAQAFDNAGVRIMSLPTLTPTIDSGRGGGVSTIRLAGLNNRPIAKVQLIPQNDYVGYRDLNVVAAPITVRPSNPVTAVQAVPVSPANPSLRTINLNDIVTVDVATINRQYVKGTLSAMPTQAITVRNTSDDIEVYVTFLTLLGVTFDPTNFALGPKAERIVTLGFDVTQINTLPEGVNTFNIAMNLTSPNALVPAAVTPAAVIAPPVIPPVELPPEPETPIAIDTGTVEDGLTNIPVVPVSGGGGSGGGGTFFDDREREFNEDASRGGIDERTINAQ